MSDTMPRVTDTTAIYVCTDIEARIFETPKKKKTNISLEEKIK